MGLRPDEPRALARIESQLAESDPALATMFAAFDDDPSRARENLVPARPFTRPFKPPFARSRPARVSWATLLIVLVICLAACVAMVIITA
ncbi:MAG: DUF3040 domain-containing protein [Nocardiopsaceae bacterium]|nr:DUF3040 domain-containing protein [Nocardiopsaceae bacterium]